MTSAIINRIMHRERRADPEVVFSEIVPARARSGAQRQPWGKVQAWWQRLLRLSRRPPRRLRLAESLPLGERRFVAVIEFEQLRFLVGGTSASLVLLARLEDDSGGTSSPVGNEKAPMPAKEQP